MQLKLLVQRVLLIPAAQLMAQACACADQMLNAAVLLLNATQASHPRHVLRATIRFVNSRCHTVFPLERLEQGNVNVVCRQLVALQIKLGIDALKVMQQVCACVEKLHFVPQEVLLKHVSIMPYHLYLFPGIQHQLANAPDLPAPRHRLG